VPAQGLIDEALAYAEASRGLNQPDTAIDAACERILLDAGRVDEDRRLWQVTALALTGSREPQNSENC
jgi:hypothetical protein